MTRASALALAFFVVTWAAACSRGKDDSQGLPPADKWEPPAGSGPGPTVEAPKTPTEQPPAAGSADPHAGLGMRGDPHAGMRGDPHAGLDMGAGPHAGLGTRRGDVADHGLPGGDPAAPIDESKFLSGTIVVAANTAARVDPASVVFLSVYRYDSEAERTVGRPIATEKLERAAFPARFRLTERNAMGGGGFAGDVLIKAWTDRDHDAVSKQAGDVLGTVTATIPAEDLELTLDTVLE